MGVHFYKNATSAEDAKELWSEDDRGAFCAWLSAKPEAGDVIPGGGELWLLVIYAKSVRGNIPAHFLNSVREVIENG